MKGSKSSSDPAPGRSFSTIKNHHKEKCYGAVKGI